MSNNSFLPCVFAVLVLCGGMYGDTVVAAEKNEKHSNSMRLFSFLSSPSVKNGQPLEIKAFVARDISVKKVSASVGEIETVELMRRESSTRLLVLPS